MTRTWPHFLHLSHFPRELLCWPSITDNITRHSDQHCPPQISFFGQQEGKSLERDCNKWSCGKSNYNDEEWILFYLVTHPVTLLPFSAHLYLHFSSSCNWFYVSFSMHSSPVESCNYSCLVSNDINVLCGREEMTDHCLKHRHKRREFADGIQSPRLKRKNLANNRWPFPHFIRVANNRQDWIKGRGSGKLVSAVVVGFLTLYPWIIPENLI